MSDNICPVHKDDDLICGIAVRIEHDLLLNKIVSAREVISHITGIINGLYDLGKKSKLLAIQETAQAWIDGNQ